MCECSLSLSLSFFRRAQNTTVLADRNRSRGMAKQPDSLYSSFDAIKSEGGSKSHAMKLMWAGL